MKDKELLLLPDWRFCRIKRGDKKPIGTNWQKNLLTLDQIPDEDNIGVILGEASNGLLAIDFDGPWAWEYWTEHIKIDFSIINTITWTSNKPGRCQMGFQVPKEIWPHMPTKFAVSGPIGDDGKNQQLEFRWGNLTTGFQSVLPPSIHPEHQTNPDINYQWIISPSQSSLQEVPIELLEWAFSYKKPEPEVIINLPDPDTSDDMIMKVDAILAKIKQKESKLDYDRWIKITFSTATHVGPSTAAIMMNMYWPEQKPGEYARLLKTYKHGKSHGFISITNAKAIPFSDKKYWR
jgi:hypothetical protein